jgi:hypothetical protein
LISEAVRLPSLAAAPARPVAVPRELIVFLAPGFIKGAFIPADGGRIAVAAGVNQSLAKESA